jgi:hypothetical protein
LRKLFIKKLLTGFHFVLLISLLAFTLLEPDEMIMVTALPVLLIILIIILIFNESRFILIPSVLLILISTIAFAMMVVGNIVWSEVTVFLVIVLYLIFLTLEILTIVFAMQNFKKQL